MNYHDISSLTESMSNLRIIAPDTNIDVNERAAQSQIYVRQQEAFNAALQRAETHDIAVAIVFVANSYYSGTGVAINAHEYRRWYLQAINVLRFQGNRGRIAIQSDLRVVGNCNRRLVIEYYE